MKADDVRLTTFFVRDLWLGIEIEKVLEINRAGDITRVPNAPSEVIGVINLRGHLVTIVDLQRVLIGADPGDLEPSQVNVIIESRCEEVGLRAERLGNVETFAPEELDSVPAHLSERHGRYFRGVLEREGAILAVLDVDAVLAVEA